MTILDVGEIGEYLYCPITGKPMLGEIEPEVVPSVVAFWAMEVPEEPTFIRDENLRNQWERYLEDLEASNAARGEYEIEYPEPEEFLADVDSSTLFCLKAYQFYGCLVVFDNAKALEYLETEEN
jgi:hypothetical protein